LATFSADQLDEYLENLLKIDLEDDDASELRRIDVERILALSQRTGVDILSQLFEWLSATENATKAIERLRQLDVYTLERLEVLARLSALKAVWLEWTSKLKDGGEEYWQRSLEDHAFVLGQLVASPIMVIKGKAYVGGKGIENTGGHLADYLGKNPMTQNAVIVELKTPQTPLLETSPYRGRVFPQSREISGAIAQVLSYRSSLERESSTLQSSSAGHFHAFRPRCLVIAGNTAELTDEDRIRSFELIRAELKDIVVVTYDELVAKLGQLIHALEGEPEGATT